MTDEQPPLVIEVTETVTVTTTVTSLHASRAQANPAEPFPGPLSDRPRVR